MTTLTPDQSRRNQRVIIAAAAIIFGSVFAGLLFGRLSPHAREAREFLRTLPVDRITEIRLQPYSVMSLVKQEVVITNRADIERIASELRDAPGVSLNHPNARWVAILRIRTAEGDYGGQVESTTNQGVIMMFASEVEGGWNYGAVRRDTLGPVLEALADGGS